VNGPRVRVRENPGDTETKCISTLKGFANRRTLSGLKRN
jgi:hypothetical protein